MTNQKELVVIYVRILKRNIADVAKLEAH